MKILRTLVTNNLSWNKIFDKITQKVDSRMQLLRQVWSFGSTNSAMVHSWKVYCLSILEPSCVVWDSGLTTENQNDMERTQKLFYKLVVEETYKNYSEALITLGLETLESRKKALTLSFIKRSLVDGHLQDLFPKNNKQHSRVTR